MNRPNPQDVLKQSTTVAIIGCSSNSYRTSNYAASYLKRKGFKIFPVNPKETEILGEPCFASITDIPESEQIDIVNVFRNKRYTEAEVEQVIDWSEKTGQHPVIWTQLDVSSPQAERKAEEAGLPYLRNLCIMVELDRIGI